MESEFSTGTEQQFELETRELFSNPDSRVPIVICIEASYGMRGRLLEQVLKAVEAFCDNIKNDPIARNCVELCIISYGGEMARVESRFALARNLEVPALKGHGGTPLGDAAEMAVQLLEIRRSNYGLSGIGNQAPLILFIGGGGRTASLGDTAKRLHKKMADSGITVKCLGVGDRTTVQKSSLKELAPDGKILFLEELKITKFFDFLSQAVRRSSDSIMREEASYAELEAWEDTLS